MIYICNSHRYKNVFIFVNNYNNPTLMLIDFCHYVICNIKICYIKISVLLSCLYSGFYMIFSKVINNMVYVTDTVISEKESHQRVIWDENYLFIN